MQTDQQMPRQLIIFFLIGLVTIAIIITSVIRESAYERSLIMSSGVPTLLGKNMLVLSKNYDEKFSEEYLFINYDKFKAKLIKAKEKQLQVFIFIKEDSLKNPNGTVKYKREIVKVTGIDA
jgi:hypothetical protein